MFKAPLVEQLRPTFETNFDPKTADVETMDKGALEAILKPVLKVRDENEYKAIYDTWFDKYNATVDAYCEELKTYQEGQKMFDPKHKNKNMFDPKSHNEYREKMKLKILKKKSFGHTPDYDERYGAVLKWSKEEELAENLRKLNLQEKTAYKGFRLAQKEKKNDWKTATAAAEAQRVEDEKQQKYTHETMSPFWIKRIKQAEEEDARRNALANRIKNKRAAARAEARAAKNKEN